MAFVLTLMAFRGRKISRNKKCLVCLETVHRDGSALTCATCPRVMHFGCLDKDRPHGGHESHCPLCVKRRWGQISPTAPARRISHSHDDHLMKRACRYGTWHNINCAHIAEWNKFDHDGTIENDRVLLLIMEATVKSRNPAASVLSAPGDLGMREDEMSVADDISSEGEAAQCYDPAASRLGGETPRSRPESHVSQSSVSRGGEVRTRDFAPPVAGSQISRGSKQGSRVSPLRNLSDIARSASEAASRVSSKARSKVSSSTASKGIVQPENEPASLVSSKPESNISLPTALKGVVPPRQ